MHHVLEIASQDAILGISGNRLDPQASRRHGVAIFLIIREMLMPLGDMVSASLTEASGGNSVHDELA